MKLFGFPTLRLGSLEVKLTNKLVSSSGDIVDRVQQRLAVCSSCDFCCPSMHFAGCGHFFCDRCLLDVPGRSEEDQMALCTICRRVEVTMEIPTQEGFVAQLACTCPSCGVALTVRELRDHFITCTAIISEPSTPPIASKPPPKVPVATGGDPATQSPSWGTGCSSGCPSDLNSISVVVSKHQNRLNTIGEHMQNLRRLIAPVYPARYSLRLQYAYAILSTAKMYRSNVVYQDGLGFYLAANDRGPALTLQFTYLDKNYRSDKDVSLIWKISVQAEKPELHEASLTHIVRAPHVGQTIEFGPFFEGTNTRNINVALSIEKLK